MNQKEIKIATNEAIERCGMKKDYIAYTLHVKPTAVSNWLSEGRNFPLQNLSDVAKLLNDDFFSYQVAEYVTGTKLLPDNAVATMVTQNAYFASIKEENDRKELETQKFLTIMAKMPNLNDEEIGFMEIYLKEHEEENQQELVYCAYLRETLDRSKLHTISVTTR